MFSAERRRRYFQERLETPLHRMGFLGRPGEIIIKEFQRCLSHVAPESIIPDRFYDIEQTIAAVAAKKGISTEMVRSNIPKHAADFFAVHKIQFIKPPEPYMPSAAIDPPAPAKRSTIIHPPVKSLFGEEAAKDKPCSSAVQHSREVIDIRVVAQTLLLQPVKQEETKKPDILNTPPAVKVKKCIPDDTTLMEAMFQHKKHYGHLPKDGTDFLPENSYNWTSIASSLRKRGYSIRLFFKTNTHEPGLVAPDWPKGRKPSLEDIQGKAMTRYIQEKDMPLRPLIPRAPKAEQPIRPKRVRPEMPEDSKLIEAIHGYYREARKMPTSGRHKLDDKSPAWPAIMADLRQRGTTITNFYRDHISLLAEDAQAEATALFSPRRAERTNALQKTIPENDVLLAAALAVRAQKKRLPDARDKYEHLPEDSYGWAHIRKKVNLPKLVSRHDRKIQRAEEKEKLGDERIHASQIFRTALSHYSPRRGFNGTAAEMDVLFRHKRVDGLDSIFDETRAKKIKTTEDFLKATGVIKKDGTGKHIPDPVLIQTFKTVLGL